MPTTHPILQHIVLFKLPDDTSIDEAHSICDQFYSLATECLHPETSLPYILSIKGGKTISQTGYTGGYTHSFIVEFASVRDCDYYVWTDPAHAAFATKLIQATKGGVKADRVTWVDFVEGVV